MENIRFPRKIIFAEGDIRNAAALLKPCELQIGLAETQVASFSGKTALILDYGKEIPGGVRILTYTADGNARVRLRFGESVTECCADIGEHNATNDHAVRDLVTELKEYSDMRFGGTGFRFLRIDTEEGGAWRIKSVAAEVALDDRPQRGSFVCDDPLVNDIWDTAAYTLRCCLQNGYLWDGIKRDRLVWIGDLYAEMHAAYAVYGDLPEIRKSLHFCSREMDSYCKETEVSGWINGIPMFSFWWLLDVCTDYRHTGNADFAAAHMPHIRKILAAIDKNVLSDGTTVFEYNFIDWRLHCEKDDGEEKRSDELAGVHYLLLLTLRSVKELLAALREDTALVDAVLRKLSANSPSVRRYKQSAALAILAGEGGERNVQILKRGGAKDITVFMAYPILAALCNSGEYAFAFSVMKEYYGGMLGLGATTFWEDFDTEAAANSQKLDEMPDPTKKNFHRDFGVYCYKGLRHSLCHGWSSGVIAYMTEYILGLKEAGVGGTKFALCPHLDGLRSVTGKYPTPFGDIVVEHKKKADGSIDTKITAPKEIEIIEESEKNPT